MKVYRYQITKFAAPFPNQIGTVEITLDKTATEIMDPEEVADLFGEDIKVLHVREYDREDQ